MKIRVLAALLLAPSLLLADPATINRSSTTKTNQTAAYIQATHLDKVVIGTANSNGTLIIWNSTTTTSAFLTDATLISSMTTAAAATFDFNNLQVKGIVYQTNNNTNGVTILYKK